MLDEWFEHEVKPRMRGWAFEVRDADDAVRVFEHEDDERRAHGVLGKRLAKDGHGMHPEKTRRVKSVRASKSRRGGSQRERSVAMLGFTHDWGRSRKGRWVVRRKTAKERFRRAVKGMSHGCRIHRRGTLREQQAVLSRKLRGHDADDGIPGNAHALTRLRFCGGEVRVQVARSARRTGCDDVEALQGGHDSRPAPPARVVPSASR